MKWIKKGLIFKPDKRLFWSKTHSMIPTPLKLNEKELKVFIQVEINTIVLILVL